MSHLLLRHFNIWFLDCYRQIKNERRYDKVMIMLWYVLYYVKRVVFNE